MSEDKLMTKEEMIHFRTQNPDGSINPCGGVTVCYYVTEDGNQCYFGSSVCSANDNYQKRLGSIKARGNAKHLEKRDKNAMWFLQTREDMFEKATTIANERWEQVCKNRGSARPIVAITRSLVEA